MKRIRTQLGTAFVLLSIGGMAVAENAPVIETEVISAPTSIEADPIADRDGAADRRADSGERGDRAGKQGGQRDGTRSGTRDGSRRGTRSTWGGSGL